MSSPLQTALSLLARREHSAHELTQKLLRKGYVQAEVKLALTQCQEKGFQSDVRFTEMLCRTRIRQGYGPLRIIQELKMQGIEKAQADKAFSASEVDWYEQALIVLKKRKQYGNTSAQKRYLYARGFSVEIICNVLREQA